ncbi:hypothetical protein D3C87_475730 [compost metagenome]
MNVSTFTRQRVRIERRFPVGAKRDRAMAHLVADAAAVLVVIERRVVAWRLQCGTTVCVKKRYPNHGAAAQHLDRIRDESHRHHLPQRVYHCERCSGYHLTSQERRAV